jgi:pullulanase
MIKYCAGGLMIKKLLRLTLAIIMMALPLFSFIETLDVFAQDVVSVEIHYSRPDGVYTDWNLWIWEVGKDGKAYEFDEVGANGAVARIELNSKASEIGFIVRLGDDWATKDVDADRFIEVKDGKAIAYLKSGDSTVYDNKDYKAPEIVVVEGDVLINIHYRRFDGNYTGWNAWVWPKGSEGAAYPITGTDDFGSIISLTFDASLASEAGFIIRLNEWAQKDVDQDRFIDITKSKNNVLNVYLVQGDVTVYYNINDVDLSPKFLSAKLEGVDRINIALSVPLTLKENVDQGFVISDGTNSFPIRRIMFAEFLSKTSSRMDIFTQEPLDLGKSYTISHPNYGTTDIVFNKVFSSEAFEATYHFEGELGALYTPTKTEFRLWAPTAQAVSLNLFDSGHEGVAKQTIEMTKTLGAGVWSVSVDGDLDKTYFTYTVNVNGVENEAVDPYARAVGVNGLRGMVVDLSKTNPEGWDSHTRPNDIPYTDAIIYELHVRDLSVSPDSGLTNKGKYLAFTERGTKGPGDVATGVDHLVEMGITHLHLLPVFDFRSINETTLQNNSFNWGYDPQHFNVPEGSYSTDPYNGEVRINEFKQMVKSLHEADIRVVMDVVYNHTGASADSDFSKIAPFYYYRFNENGSFSNGSGTGNETASERSMVRKHFIDSVVYWATEYKIDGFRFDLMALHDIETMNMIRAALDEVNPNILIYGEGWTGGGTPLPENQQALKINASKLDRIAVFSDDMRDGIKGSVFVDTDKGFVNGKLNLENTIRFGIVASIQHPGVRSSDILYSSKFWAKEPYHTINYNEAHDNKTLYDKLMATNPEASAEEIAQMHRFANAIVLTSQGIPFIHAGSEWMRTKFGDHNSYQSPDSINQLVWADKNTNMSHVDYFKGLISLRKNHAAFRLPTADLIREHLNFIDSPANTVAYSITNAPEETWENITVLINGNEEATTFELPSRGWVVVVNGEQAGETSLARVSGDSITVDAKTLVVLVDSQSFGSNQILVWFGLTLVALAGVLGYIFKDKIFTKKA